LTRELTDRYMKKKDRLSKDKLIKIGAPIATSPTPHANKEPETNEYLIDGILNKFIVPPLILRD
jgi:hypothetical protein